MKLTNRTLIADVSIDSNYQATIKIIVALTNSFLASYLMYVLFFTWSENVVLSLMLPLCFSLTGIFYMFLVIENQINLNVIKNSNLSDLVSGALEGGVFEKRIFKLILLDYFSDLSSSSLDDNESRWYLSGVNSFLKLINNDKNIAEISVFDFVNLDISMEYKGEIDESILSGLNNG